jgi:hypothetical protein
MATKKSWIVGNEGENKCFYLSTTDEHEQVMVYASESFKFLEEDIINLIKICLINSRDKSIGRKILAIYRDSTQNRAEITRQRLKMIGIEQNGIPKAERLTRKPKLK